MVKVRDDLPRRSLRPGGFPTRQHQATAMDRRTSVSTARLFRKSSVAALGALALAGCGMLKAPSPTELSLACPKVQIVRDLQEVSHFAAGASQDATALVSRAAIANYSGGCEYGSDGVTVNVVITFVGEKGPRLTTPGDRYRYFVAVYRPGEQTPANKVEFETGVKFPKDDNRGIWTEEVAPHIPLPKDANAKDWQVMIGFQLSGDELGYNRSATRRGRN